MDSLTVRWILAFVLVFAGLAGMVLPAIPGAVLVFAGLVVAAWAEGFVYVGWKTITVLALMTGLAYLADLVAAAFGAKRFGAGKYAAAGAITGAAAGLFFGIPGMLAGPFLGAVLGELLVRRDLRAAGLAGIGAWIGIVAGTAARIAIALSMIGIFFLVRFVSVE
jgi:uncharacterized protein YqgC (DUF456 family)